MFKKESTVLIFTVAIWSINCLLGIAISLREVWIPFMNAGWDKYISIQSEPFDGTIMPIAYIPDWTRTENQDKSKRFEDISISQFLPIPPYDPLLLLDSTNTTKAWTILRYTYTTPYMWSYKLNYKEFDGSHLGVDIRAPIGTPILSIANGVVVRTVEADSTGNKFVVIRHDGVTIGKGTTSVYSAYLHLSEITVTEWEKITKWSMLWRVGITGITTTPHLHFQIDTIDAPFHPYWPFTTTDSKSQWLSMFESVNAWLGKEDALRYTIHPMNFINMYLGWLNLWTSSQIIHVDSEKSFPSTSIVASENIFKWESDCSNKYFTDVSAKSTLWKIMYPVIHWHCLYSTQSEFRPKESVTLKEAIMAIMKITHAPPANGISHFLDIEIGDEFQGYALAWYKKWILNGNYAEPNKIMTKWEFIHLLMEYYPAQKNPSNIRIFSDTTSMHPYYQSIQNYGYMMRLRGWKIYPDTILTRSNLMQILSNIEKKNRFSPKNQ